MFKVEQQSKGVYPRIVGILVFLCAFAGCAVHTIAVGAKGTDVSEIVIGVSRTETEKILGRHVKKISIANQIDYWMYSFDSGRPPDRKKATLALGVDILVGLLPELLFDEKKYDAKFRNITTVLISYDSDDKIIGIFQEFDDLPINGYPTKFQSVKELELYQKRTN